MSEYIEREEVIKTVMSCTDPYEPPYVDITVNDIVAKISNIPSADVMPVVHGKWSRNCCSVCGISKYNFISFDFNDDKGYAKPFGTWKYCPHCGARMDGET